jgi:hypothetical protein
MNYFNTLDLDNIDKETLSLTIQKILKNKCCKSLEYKDSSTKGYHIKMICDKKCDLCRFVFDDIRRYAIDLQREEKFRNVLFNEKEFFNPENKKKVWVKMNCEKCEKNKVNTDLAEKELTFEETLTKLKEGKIKVPLTIFGKEKTLQALYFGYAYLECPLCHWFKFVKKTEIKT